MVRSGSTWQDFLYSVQGYYEISNAVRRCLSYCNYKFLVEAVLLDKDPDVRIQLAVFVAPDKRQTPREGCLYGLVLEIPNLCTL